MAGALAPALRTLERGNRPEPPLGFFIVAGHRGDCHLATEPLPVPVRLLLPADHRALSWSRAEYHAGGSPRVRKAAIPQGCQRAMGSRTRQRPATRAPERAAAHARAHVVIAGSMT